jgi:hypothetical protein
LQCKASEQLEIKTNMAQWLAATQSLSPVHASALTATWQNTAAGAVLLQQYSLHATALRKGEFKSSVDSSKMLQDREVCRHVIALLLQRLV